MPKAATGFEEPTMTLDHLLGAVVTAVLLVYLTYALIRAETF